MSGGKECRPSNACREAVYRDHSLRRKFASGSCDRTGCGDVDKAEDIRRLGVSSRSGTSLGIGGHTQPGVDRKEAGIRLQD